MKGRANGFISGVLFTLVFVSLIGTAFASKGRVAVNVDYNDIRVTLDGKAVALVDANGNAVEPFAINGTTYLPVRAVANALGLEVGWDQETSTVVLKSTDMKTQEDEGNSITSTTSDTSTSTSSLNNASSGTSSSKNTSLDDGDMPDGSLMVYVTPTGKRYHYDSTCNGGKYTLTTLENAKRRGLTPCQKCVLH